jgi:hypothetical protein
VLAALGVAALVTLLVNHLFQVSVAWSIVLSLPVAGLVLLAMLLAGAADANWEPVPSDNFTPSELHASTLATRFAEAAKDQHRFTTRVQPRLCRLALATLRARPGTADLTTLTDPRAREALGADLHTVLTDRTARLPDPRTLAALLHRLEG